MTDNHDLEALATNPHTDWDVLHWIAENHPELRPAVAANPGTYQELVDALAALGDPEIDAAIAQREATGGVGEPEVESEPDPHPMAGMWDIPSGAFPAAEPEPPTPVTPVSAEPAEPVGAEPVPAVQQELAEPGPAEYEPRQKRELPVLPIAAAVLGLLSVGAVIGLLVMLLSGGDDDPPAAGQTPDPQPTAEDQAEPGDENGEADNGEDEPAVDEQALAQARAAVQELGENPSCDTSEDAGVVAAFLAAAGAEEDFPGQEDSELLESAFESIQSDCSPAEAAATFESARSGPQAPEDGQGAALTAVGTDWVTRGINDMRGAEQISSFTAQGGNVECEFSDGLTCTVYSTTAEPCDEGATYRMTVQGAEVDCEAHLESGNREQTLSEGDAATDGFLVCQELSDRLTCFNTVEVFGFEVSNTGHYTW
ncbi:variant leucine-rich repeat-containing protein [Nesterenkonia ebinurensis]|uniref:variant leucine-rich repeat-containing protein n=1 Tax=Nesterenkonia ebinurensis TaxID=2608252 RepID=UPI00123D4E90|nr:hypothetical protein [Nesterenkonia ebinurensis]